jgi:hypothetical protein
MTIRHILIVAAVVCLTPGIAAGQANPDSIHLRNDCRLAAQVLQAGQPANKREWAMAFIPSCGQGGVSAIVEKWRTNEASADSALLSDLRVAAFHLVDRSLFETFLATAGSPVASTRARIEAWRYLFRFSNPGIFLPEEQLGITPVTRLCAVGYFTISNPVIISPLPTDFRDQVDQLAVRVSAEQADVRVQRFASCVHQFIQQARSNP